MAQLKLILFGGFGVTLEGRPLADFATDKVRALLAYLALEPQPQTRSRIAGLFWPDAAEQSALTNLRQTVHRLRQTLERAEPGAGARLLAASRQTLRLNPDLLAVDVIAFEHLVSICASHPHEKLATCNDCLPRLTEAANLYRGELLAGFGLVDASAFEEWLLLQREYLQGQALQLFHTLADAHEADGDAERAHHWAARQLALDPYRESAHRQMMRSLARRGQQTAALVQFERCRRLLHTELGVEPSDETITLYEEIRTSKGMSGWSGREVRARSSPNTSTPLLPHSPTPPPNNLPAELTPFIGREQELAALTTRLQDPGVRLLTLIGAGGIGKTRLALAVAQAISDYELSILDASEGFEPPTNPKFPDGVFFVALAPLTEVTAIAAGIAAAIGLELRGDDPVQALLQALHSKRMLLVLDNFEHLLEGVGLVAAILQRAPGVQILATSRERLALRGEHLYLVQGLENAAGESVAEALVSASVQLFVQSAQRAQAGFQLNAPNAATVVRICRLVRGVPLALELAAAWVGTLPLQTIAREIEQRADFLAFDWRDAPERQRSMRAVFDWSWKLLNQEERRVLRGVAVFRGGFTVDAAQTVAGAAWATLTSLVHKSLLSWGESHGEGGRYDCHELLRQFAAQQLPAEELAATEERHSRFYLTYVAAREQRLARHEPQHAAAEIQREIDNIRQAWGWASRKCAIYDLDVSAFALWQYYYFTGFWSEGAAAFQMAAGHVRRQVLSERESSPERAPSPSRGLLSKLLAIHASLLISLSKHDQALAQAQEAIALGANGVSVEGETLGHLVWGQALRRRGQDQAAHMQLERTVDLTQRYQHGEHFYEALPEIETRAYGWLCSIALNPLHDFAAARYYSEQRLQVCRRWGKIYGEAVGLTDLVDIAKALGDLAAARSECQRVLHLAHKVGNRWLEAISSRDLGEILYLLGEYSPAYASTLRALTLFREVGDAVNEIASLTTLGRLCTLMGAYDLAHEWFGHFQRGMTTVEALAGEFLDGLLAQALLAHHQGDEQQALDCADQSWDLAQEIGDPVRQARAQVYRGHACAGLRRWSAAAAAYQQALALYTETDRATLATEPRAGLAAIALAQDDLALALEGVEAILPVLATNRQVGIDEPFYTYWVCHRVLAANGDLRAVAVLEMANDLLQHYAAHIADDATRRSFLERAQLLPSLDDQNRLVTGGDLTRRKSKTSLNST